MSEELKRAVEQIDRWANYEWTTADQIAVKSELSTFTAGDLRLLLSERAELLAAVERLRGALDGINKLARDQLALIPPDLVHFGVLGELLLEILARAVLTTGEATTPNAGERG